MSDVAASINDLSFSDGFVVSNFKRWQYFNAIVYTQAKFYSYKTPYLQGSQEQMLGTTIGNVNRREYGLVVIADSQQKKMMGLGSVDWLQVVCPSTDSEESIDVVIAARTRFHMARPVL